MVKKTFFKKTGRKLGRELKEIKLKEKEVRALEKEKEIRDRRETLNKKIRTLKGQKPSFIKGVGRVARASGRGIAVGVKGFTGITRAKREAAIRREERSKITKSIKKKITLKKPKKKGKKKVTRRRVRQQVRREVRREPVQRAEPPKRSREEDTLSFISRL